MLTLCSEIPLPVSCAELYKGLAFDGCQYYLTIRCECRIDILDRELCPVKTIKTRRPYTAICYDFKRNCFWAATSQCWTTLFRLDTYLQEIDMLTPSLKYCCAGPFSGITYCCENGLLLAASGNRLLEVDPDCGTARLLREECKNAHILSVACLPPYAAYCVLRGRKPYFVLITCAGELVSEEETPAECIIDAMLLEPCSCIPCNCGLLCLTNKHGCYPYLLRAPLEENICGTLCPCNRVICCKCGQACRPFSTNACADVLESIALQEAAIAHILNAEGEKLQKVINTSDSACELLNVNESVQKTIIYATHLEQVLFSKLDVLQGICCCEPECPPCPDCCEPEHPHFHDCCDK